MPVTQVIIQGSVSQQEQGIASSARQFFLQIAQVMGLAILGLIFTTSYASGFAANSEGFAQTLPPVAHAAFSEDPTITLDAKRYRPIESSILAQPDGTALLEKTREAQRNGVARGIDGVYTGSLIAGLIILAVCLTLREIPSGAHSTSPPRCSTSERRGASLTESQAKLP